jgi:catechol 2,3-dioxygenase-like lactoylglutathione lyase family enzyme
VKLPAAHICLDHFIVPSRNRVAAARQLGELLGVQWAENGPVGPFSPVYVSDDLTLDFDETAEVYPIGHYAFRVGQEMFDAILQRLTAAGIAYRSTPHGPIDMAINNYLGGSLVYWNEPAGHVWEILTVSYERCAP